MAVGRALALGAVAAVAMSAHAQAEAPAPGQVIGYANADRSGPSQVWDLPPDKPYLAVPVIGPKLNGRVALVDTGPEVGAILFQKPYFTARDVGCQPDLGTDARSNLRWLGATARFVPAPPGQSPAPAGEDGGYGSLILYRADLGPPPGALLLDRRPTIGMRCANPIHKTFYNRIFVPMAEAPETARCFDLVGDYPSGGAKPVPIDFVRSDRLIVLMPGDEDERYGPVRHDVTVALFDGLGCKGESVSFASRALLTRDIRLGQFQFRNRARSIRIVYDGGNAEPFLVRKAPEPPPAPKPAPAVAEAPPPTPEPAAPALTAAKPMADPSVGLPAKPVPAATPEPAPAASAEPMAKPVSEPMPAPAPAKAAEPAPVTAPSASYTATVEPLPAPEPAVSQPAEPEPAVSQAATPEPVAPPKAAVGTPVESAPTEDAPMAAAPQPTAPSPTEAPAPTETTSPRETQQAMPQLAPAVPRTVPPGLPKLSPVLPPQLGQPVAAAAGMRRFEYPMQKIYRLNACLTWRTDCGGPAATAWCKARGFDHAVDWTLDEGIGANFPSIGIGDGRVCAEAWCSGFRAITCGR